MAISCPTCGTPAGGAGRPRSRGLVCCPVCETTWLARPLPVDPSQDLAGADPEISDAVVIEEAPAPPPADRVRPALSRPSLPPRSHAPAEVSTADRWVGRWAVAGAASFGFAVVLAIALLRAPLVAALPDLAPVAGSGVPGVEFQAVRSQTMVVAGARTLVVEGDIVNTRQVSVDLPRMRITLKGSDGKDVTSWDIPPAATRLAAGQSIGFRSARSSPPPGATEVTISLAR